MFETKAMQDYAFNIKITCVETILGAYTSKYYGPETFGKISPSFITTIEEALTSLFLSKSVTDLINDLNPNSMSFEQKEEFIFGSDDAGMTPLFKAAKYGNSDAITFLLNNCAFINQVSPKGKSALMYAAEYGRDDIINLLIELGADTGLISDENKTARQYNEQNKHHKIASMLNKINIPSPGYAPGELVGDWSGAYKVHNTTVYMDLKIRLQHNRLKANGTIYKGLAKEDREKAFKGKLTPKNNRSYSDDFIAEAWFDIYIRGKDIIINGRYFKKIGPTGELHGVRTSFTSNNEKVCWHMILFTLQGKRNNHGVITGHAHNATDETIFYLVPKHALNTLPPLTLPKAETVTVACLDFPQYKYNCYIPSGYNQKNAMPVILFDNAGKNAKPLNIRTAEEMGCISVGIIEPDTIKNINYFWTFATILDIKRRFNILPGKIIMAGFSGGAQFFQQFISSYLDDCCGVIDIGIGDTMALEHGIPVFYIMGEKDVRYKSLKSKFPDLEKKYGEKVNMATHAGGHMWGVPDLLDQAIRWMFKFP